jgi:hypothetical protein
MQAQEESLDLSPDRFPLLLSSTSVPAVCNPHDSAVDKGRVQELPQFDLCEVGDVLVSDGHESILGQWIESVKEPIGKVCRNCRGLVAVRALKKQFVRGLDMSRVCLPCDS